MFPRTVLTAQAILALCPLPPPPLPAAGSESPRTGSNPPAAVLRVGHAEAERQFRLLEKQKPEGVTSYPPQLRSSQRVTDFLHSGEGAWLLLYWVAEVGPRAHTPLSQLIIVSAKHHQILLSIPSRDPAHDPAAAQIAGEAQDALLVEVSPRRHALAIAHGAQSKIPGTVTLLSLSTQGPPKEIWRFPAENAGGRTESDIYFVRLPHEKATAIAVQVNEQVFDGDRQSLRKDARLYRLAPAGDNYERADVAPARLSEILARARGDGQTPHILQAGPVGVEALMETGEQATRLKGALNDADARLHAKLSHSERAQLTAEERSWLEKRDATLDPDQRNQLVTDRVKDLTQRANLHP